jgi:dual specificity tyrosine-phosphorylation-regulated kinase 2/3/4
MEKKKTYTISKSTQKLPTNSANFEHSKKPLRAFENLKNSDLKYQRTLANPIINKITTKLPKSTLDPIETVPLSKRSKRNKSVEGNYEEIDQQDKISKKSNSLLGNQPKQELWNPSSVPYAPGYTIKNFSKFLTGYEQSEILNYKNIYYIAPGVNKIPINLKSLNCGFDDERDDYILIKNDHIAYRYEILEILGKGSYGRVAKVYDHKEKKFVALKIIRNMPCILQQAKVEIQVLYKLINQENPSQHVIKILDHIIFRNHIMESFDLLDMNLYQLLKIRSFSPLPMDNIRSYTHQILEGIKYYQSLHILHCDLKPENVMIRQDGSQIKIIDFGSACFEDKKIFTYIQSRYYRAPEVLLEIGYDYKIDIWSLGCIVAELYLGKPLFPGKNEADQLNCIIEVIGFPPTEMLEKSFKYENMSTGIKKINLGSGKSWSLTSKSIKQLIGSNDSLFYDFLTSNFYIECLAWNPDERFSAEEALNHDWFKVSKTPKNSILPEIKQDKLSMPSSINNIKKAMSLALSHRNLKIINKKSPTGS